MILSLSYAVIYRFLAAWDTKMFSYWVGQKQNMFDQVFFPKTKTLSIFGAKSNRFKNRAFSFLKFSTVLAFF